MGFQSFTLHKTYKQALRGLFVAGTSPDAKSVREKVGDEPRLNPCILQDVLHNLAGKTVSK